MFACPNCRCPLERVQSTAGMFWACEKCGGRTVAVPILRKVVYEQAIKALWVSAQSGAVGRRRCPTCGNRMCEASASGVPLDVCKLCQFVWFDPREFEQLPAAPVPKQEAGLPQAVREAIAVYEVKQMQERLEEEGPPEDWQRVPAVFGLPVECNSQGITRLPVLTWSVSLVVLIVSIVGFIKGETFVRELALIPADLWRLNGITLISSFFVHGGVIHLVSNLYFLLIFGDNVEEHLGWRRFGLLLLAATIAGSLLHASGDPHSKTPCIGASGGISGVIVFYAMKYPRARLGLYLSAWYRWSWVQFPAWAGLAAWVFLQGVGLVQQLSGFSNVSALAHIGGAAVGFAFWVMWKDKGAVPEARE